MSVTFGNEFSDRLSFIAEYFDYESAYQKKLLLNYYPYDNTVELYDTILKRPFLKRSHYENIHPDNFFIDSTVRIYGRQLKITDYADCHTKTLIGHTHQHTFGLIKPSVINKIGEIFNQIQARGFQITKIRMCHLNQLQCSEIYDHLRGSAFFPFIVDHIISEPVVAIELVGSNAVERFKENVGPVDPLEARKVAPDTLRAIYGSEKQSNGFHASHSLEQASKNSQMFFGQDSKSLPKTTVQLDNTTCCVIKPHAIKNGDLGHIISFISENKFKVTAMQSFHLSKANAEEFLEVYKGVVSDFHAFLLSFLDGLCVALEISKLSDNMEDVHGEFRKLVGPLDPDVAKQIRPNTLRARFGVDKFKNAVHCTDLKEDTTLELTYFFKILS